MYLGRVIDRGPRKLVHGEAAHGRETAEYKAWASIKARCTNSTVRNYSNYGGRGITICDAWRDSFEQFLVDVGRRPSTAHSIDRIDTNGHYEPGNVQWSTRVEQARNKRGNRLITFDGVTRCLAEWSEITGLGPATIVGRLDLGWTIQHALTTPVRTHR